MRIRRFDRCVKACPATVRPNGYIDTRGFDAVHPQSIAIPAQRQPADPFDLMPPPVVRFEETGPSSLRLFGQVIMLVGLLSSVLAGWYLWGTGILTDGEQSRLSDESQERLLAIPDVTALPLGEEAAEAALVIDVPVDWDNPVIPGINLAPPQLEAVPELPSLIPEAAPLMPSTFTLPPLLRRLTGQDDSVA